MLKVLRYLKFLWWAIVLSNNRKPRQDLRRRFHKFMEAMMCEQYLTSIVPIFLYHSSTFFKIGDFISSRLL